MQIKHLIIINFLSIYILPAHAQDSALNNENWSKQNQKIVTDFINSVKIKNLDELCSRISFPFVREYPIPEIKTKKDFLKRYSEIFDDSLTKMIVNSNPDKDWSAVGWLGIMLFNGELWLDYDGRLTGVNYQSKFEKKELEELIKIEKKDLYVSIKEFKQPICILETTKYRIRIDDLGDWNYRYVSWPLNSKMSDKPEIVLEKGEYVPDGSGGNHSYKFKNADYVYECSIIVMGEDDGAPAWLTIYKGDKVILAQRAEIIVK
jgi:hypothetical protein